MIRILDYGMGNLRSVERALDSLGAESSVGTNLDGADKLIIPGVGAFGAAMECLAPLKSEITRAAESGMPILGICLGQQLLFERSDELGEHAGLGLLPGRVTYFPRGDVKVPHVGWNALHYHRTDGLGSASTEGEQVYFVHSLITECADPADMVATSEHGISFAAAVQRGNVWGCQFHPEKSGTVGLSILGRFVTC